MQKNYVEIRTFVWCNLKTLRHQREFIDRLVSSGEGAVDGEGVIGVPCAEGFLVDEAGALSYNPRK